MNNSSLNNIYVIWAKAKCPFQLSDYHNNKYISLVFFIIQKIDPKEAYQIHFDTKFREKNISLQNTWIGTLTQSIKLSRRPTLESTACCRLFFQRSMFDSLVNITWQHKTMSLHDFPEDDLPVNSKQCIINYIKIICPEVLLFLYECAMCNLIQNEVHRYKRKGQWWHQKNL